MHKVPIPSHIESLYLVSNVLPILGLNKYLLFICQSSQKKKISLWAQYNKRWTNPIGMWSSKFVAKFFFIVGEISPKGQI
jgi:hypothetical protein